MDPEQRTEREITYQVGWKRRKIALQQDKAQASNDESAKLVGHSAKERLLVWSFRYVWRKAVFIPDKALLVVLTVFPLIAFALSLWLVYQLSIQPY
ncbi:hypothetical protein DVH26_09630 [Paenibacillus sp. H1-7]|uniref:hypothetical protein n=1 Tax=Paenibacillus sp. H1-7 TaxID=2282849 RepID=UPI001EF89812|nr:hypothetical protein [Paenibacillus sp. H1-7]ULL14691.1 hypothetical protein DVH26_09630 [Paenibacillus sp. H1-7]